MPNNVVEWRTNWVKSTIVMYYGSPNIAPNETRPTVTKSSTRQRDLCAHGVVREDRGSPCSDQSTTTSMRSTPSWFFCAHVNQLTTLSWMYFSKIFI